MYALIVLTLAQIQTLTNQNDILAIEITKSGELFDYDMQIKTKTDAKLAKMIRFFEYVTIGKSNFLVDFSPLDGNHLIILVFQPNWLSLYRVSVWLKSMKNKFWT